MTTPSCPKCDNAGQANAIFTSTSGPLVDGDTTHAVHCTKCGAVVAIVPTGLLKKIERAKR